MRSSPSLKRQAAKVASILRAFPEPANRRGAGDDLQQEQGLLVVPGRPRLQKKKSSSLSVRKKPSRMSRPTDEDGEIWQSTEGFEEAAAPVKMI